MVFIRNLYGFNYFVVNTKTISNEGKKKIHLRIVVFEKDISG